MKYAFFIIVAAFAACTARSGKVVQCNTIMYSADSSGINFSYQRLWNFNSNQLRITDYLHEDDNAAVRVFPGYWTNDSVFTLIKPLEADSLITADAGYSLGENLGTTSFLSNKIIVHNRNRITIYYYGGGKKGEASCITETYYNPK